MRRFMKVPLIALVLGLVLVPVSIALADTQGPYTLATIEPQTIPLWGPTWDHGDVSYSIEAGRGVSQDAIGLLQQSVDDWNKAIHTRSSLFHLVPHAGGGKADITIRPKGGGGPIQGTASCKNAGGFFTSCRINVSGKAFGSTNPSLTILSIAIQEVGHALGLDHSNNSSHVMFGTLQDPPNTVISECDIDVWAEVMHWLVADGPNAHTPHVSSVSCGVADPGPGPGPGPSGDLSVDVAIGHSAGEQAPFQNKDRVHIVINVNDADGNPVDGAVVNVRIVTPNPRSDRVGEFTTANGVVDTHYRVNGRDGKGTYHVLVEEATAGSASGSCLEPDPCHADFVVQ